MKSWWKFMHWLVFRLRIYVAWSWVYNQFRNRAYRRVWVNWLRHCDSKREMGELMESDWGSRTLQRLTLADIQEALDLIEWKGDTWRALWDAVNWPEKMLFWISCRALPPTRKEDPRHALWREKGMKQPESEMDCDDFASACMWMVWRMDRDALSTAKKVVITPYFLNVARMRGSGFWGHNVCLVKWKNYDTNEIEWRHMGNWGAVGPMTTVSAAIKSIRDDLPLVSWAVLDHRHKLVDRSSKIPKEDFLK